MLHIILVILKIIGILLLALLGFLLLAVLCLLLVPVRYRAGFRRGEDGTSATAAVSWLFSLICLRVRCEKGGKPETELYLCGIPLMRLLARRREKKEKRAASARKGKPSRENAGEERTSGSAGEKEEPSGRKRLEHRDASDAPCETLRAAESGELPKPQPVSDTLWERAERAFCRFFRAVGGMVRRAFAAVRAVLAIPAKICKAISKFRLTVSRICGKIRKGRAFLKSPEFKKALKAVMRNGGKLLKHIRPRRICGSVTFGFGDPSYTGQTLALISLIYPVLPEKLAVTPDFSRAVLEADVSARGRIYGAVLLKLAVQTYLQSDIKTIIKQYKEAF